MKKKTFQKIITLAVALFGLIVLNVQNIFALAAYYIENEESSFVTTDSNGYQYKCKTLENNPGSISIGWANDDRSTTPAHLSLPSSLSFEGNEYTVKCISTGGFSNCDFSAIDIPNSIDEIKPEAFMCCINLKEVTLPENITSIQCATFMDCRNLESVKYAHEGLPEDSVNNKITIIENNAFAACYKLKRFTIPQAILEIGNCAFENCYTLPYIFLPNNPITVRSYAFSKCSNLTSFFIPKNVTCIENFAFTQCDNLTISIQASSRPSGFGKNYNYLYSGTSSTKQIDVIYNVVNVKNVDQFPGLLCSFSQKAEIKSESGKTIWKSKYDYATLISYNRTETEDIEGFMHNQIITLPDYVYDEKTNQMYPLAVIGPRAFDGHKELKGIIHNEHLVRIWYSAYRGCSNIEQLRYENCTELKEIGWYQFGDDGNNKMEELILPNSLTYFWSQCFQNLYNVSYLSFKTDPTADCSLVNIGNRCFENLGKNATSKFTLELPCSLNDGTASLAGGSGNFAVGSSAFNNALSIEKVVMAECQHGVHGLTNDNKSQISFNDKAFFGCANLKSFRSSSCLKTFKNSVFSGTNLQEIFLNLRFNTSTNFGWEKTLLGHNSVVVYTDRDPADKSWLNPESGYLQESINSNVKPTSSENSAGPCPLYVLDDLETGVTYYDNGNIATIQENGGTTITQYFGSQTTIDLTTLNTLTPIKRIGDFVFGGKGIQRVYLPDTLEEIGDRSFFSTYDSGGSLPSTVLTVLTYKVGDVIQQDPNGQSAYCRLPASCTKVGKFAFFNNGFVSVSTDSAMTTFDVSSFSTMAKITSSTTGHAVSSKIEYFDKTGFTLNNTSWVGDTLYYDENGNHVGLLYTIQKQTTGDFVIEPGTKYINAEGIFGTAATSVTIPSSLTTIYGYGVAANPLLTEIKGDLSGLKYINGPHLDPNDPDVWQANHPMTNNVTYNGASQKGAFMRNKLLTTFDFTQLTSIREIGENAFFGDAALTKMSVSQPEYKYYMNPTLTTMPKPTTKSDGVADLRNSTNLTHIGQKAFTECSLIKYVHLPDTTGNDATKISKITLPNAEIFPSCSLLVGERACQASHQVPNIAGGIQYNATDHYPANSKKNCTVYYYAETKADVSNANTAIKYWTYGETRQDFKLFSDRSKALAGLPD